MRLDNYLTNKNPEYTRSKITDLIKRGFVKVNDKTVNKAGFKVYDGDIIKLEKENVYVSRGADKLKHALSTFNLSFDNLIVVDVGSSTGGFTEIALESNAKLVYAYDVGTNQLDPRLKENDKVLSFEGTNILDVVLPLNDICIVDVSFTSVIPILNHLKDQTNEIIFLLKPQFEVDRKDLKKGILKDLRKHNDVIKKITDFINDINYKIKGFTRSSVKGKEGNTEYFFYIKRG